jgi:hypothetical protein
MFTRRALLLGVGVSLVLPKGLRAASGIGARNRLDPSMAPQVDWSNPITVGLTGAYLPGRASGTLYDMSGLGASPKCGTSGVFKPTQEGFALDTSAQGAGQGCNAVATAAQQPTKQASVFWRGVLLGTPTSNEYVFGVEFGDGNTTPFDACDLTYTSGGQIAGATNTSGTSQSLTGNITVGALMDAATTVDLLIAGTASLYVNGTLQSRTSALSGTITYGTNPQLEMGGTSSAGQNASNARHLVGYTWNRTLSDAEVLSLHYEPYQLLIFSGPK